MHPIDADTKCHITSITDLSVTGCSDAIQISTHRKVQNIELVSQMLVNQLTFARLWLLYKA